MYTSDWERLGIGPTRDIPAIKRAYALKLRATRPDDDARAYQALRAAYERVQDWARYAPDDDDAVDAEADETERENSPPAEQLVQVATPALQHEPPDEVDLPAPPAARAETEPVGEATAWPEEAALAPDETPETIVDGIYELWREQGGGALMDAWPRLEQVLDRLPLDRRPEASARFADLVISCASSLPHEFMQRLQTHFGWMGDFRIDRMIGPARAEALRQALSDMVVTPVTDQQVLRQYADVRGLHQLLQRRWRLHAWLHAALLGWPLLRQTAEAGSRLLRRFGIELPAQERLAEAMTVGMWWRVALMTALLFGASALVARGDWVVAIAATATTLAAGTAVFGGSLIFGSRLSNFLNELVQADTRPGRWLQRWRASRWAPWIGLVIGLLALPFYVWAATGDDALWWWPVGVVLTLVQLLLAWPQRPDVGVVTLGTWGFLLACLMPVASLEVPFFALLGGAGAVTLLAAQHAEGRWQFAGGGRWTWWIALAAFQFVRLNERGQASSVMQWLTVTLCALAAALLTLSCVPRDGYRTAMAPMALAGGLVFALRSVDAVERGPLLLYLWVGACLVVMLLQRGANWLDARWYGRVTDTD
ncbi:MAG: hypothetical protein KF892_14255 [Rhizobacter sp.]|nr:hypothetical protein [Rhizobacter sp.]